MATNRIQGTGLTIQVTAIGADFVSGVPMMVGDQGLVGVCIEDILTAAVGTIMVPGGIIIDYPVKGDNGGGVAIAVGDSVHWDGAAAYFDGTLADHTIGYALEAVSSGATTTVEVLLTDGSADDLRA